MMKRKHKKWEDILEDVTANYNATPHSAIKMAPEDVNQSNRDSVFATLYPDIDKKATPRLKIGNIVRLKLEKSLFDKGYAQNWSTELYQILDVRQRAGIVWYKVGDLDGKRVDGIKYYYELNKVADDFESLRT
ncbi:Oidioi.mRNA.OKI2018_I69.chr1.g792.t1.cds [Oikopleura dioica]|uniref:Oidioi.mRNA.OKI2018_I69.chr1.g792.t1.cds n=1 Tax=Oikopleura dioica TaxID=34765 RepID=A0ABN7SQ91_OIKDI|nr:Oidioi.mRNA.OKI2018_I69.chr1.g792.t1.cds [Oikopleura dioica]